MIIMIVIVIIIIVIIIAILIVIIIVIIIELQEALMSKVGDKRRLAAHLKDVSPNEENKQHEGPSKRPMIKLQCMV